jgi:hypothetical protein
MVYTAGLRRSRRKLAALLPSHIDVRGPGTWSIGGLADCRATRDGDPIAQRHVQRRVALCARLGAAPLVVEWKSAATESVAQLGILNCKHGQWTMGPGEGVEQVGPVCHSDGLEDRGF